MILTVRLFLVVDLHLRGDLEPWRRIRVRTGGLLYVAGHPGGLGLPNRNIDMRYCLTVTIWKGILPHLN